MNDHVLHERLVGVVGLRHVDAGGLPRGDCLCLLTRFTWDDHRPGVGRRGRRTAAGGQRTEGEDGADSNYETAVCPVCLTHMKTVSHLRAHHRIRSSLFLTYLLIMCHPNGTRRGPLS